MRKRKPIPEITEAQKKLFFAKIIKSDGCWEWLAATSRDGYGYFHLNRVGFMAPRIAWKIYTGNDPGELCVLHKCDNPPCCNPDHLFLGTHTDNARDRASKGRSSMLFGEDHHSTRLNDSDILKIKSFRNEGMNQSQIAKIFSVDQSHISRILNGHKRGLCPRRAERLGLGKAHGLVN